MSCLLGQYEVQTGEPSLQLHCWIPVQTRLGGLTLAVCGRETLPFAPSLLATSPS